MSAASPSAILTFAAVVAGFCFAGAPDPPARGGQLKQLREEYDRAVEAFEKARDEAHEREARARATASFRGQCRKLAGRFAALARENPGDDMALEALAWVLEEAPAAAEADGAAQTLLRLHADKPATRHLAGRLLVRTPSPAAEKLLRGLAAKTPDTGAGARSQLRLAAFLTRTADHARSLRDDEGRGRLRQDYEPALAQYLLGLDPQALTGEAQRLVAAVTAGATGGPEADYARRLAVEIRLGVGRVAPDIDGQDIDGRPMRLSDYRGKAVVLKFWGTWCGPCMGMVPHDRALVERLRGRPFALVGVENDDDHTKARRLIESRGINWRSWWDGNAKGGPIAAAWNVSGLWGWPTVYVLDARGVIRYKHLRGQALDDAVEVLVREAETPGTGK
jgi:peroxiredoxin